MILRDADRRHTFLVALCVAAAFTACGGGGNGSSGSAAADPSATPSGNPTSETGTSTPTTNGTQGLQGTPTPLPTVTATAAIVIYPGLYEDIVGRVRSAPPGSTVYFAPGIHTPFTLGASDVQGSITLAADVTGTVSESPPAAVIVDAAHAQGSAAAAAIALSGIPESSALVIDGFTLRGGTQAGVSVDGSPGTIIQNCTSDSNPGDGARLIASDRSLLFNSLLLNNSGVGVRVLGTSDLWVFSNTVYNNNGTGISIGSDQYPSPNALVENNIVIGDRGFGIAVAGNSVGSYVGDYNLNSDGYAPGTPPGPNDIVSNVSAVSLFVSPPEVYLAPDSAAIDGGNPATPDGLLALLQHGTTQTDGSPDCGFPDLGYHYPAALACGEPTPTPTPRKQ